MQQHQAQHIDTDMPIEVVKQAARQHGESSAIGDGAAHDAAWDLLTAEQRARWLADFRVSAVLESAGYAGLVDATEAVDCNEWRAACVHFGLDSTARVPDEVRRERINHYRLARIQAGSAERS